MTGNVDRPTSVTVTGGSGLLGGFVVEELLAHGHDVHVLDIKAPQQSEVRFSDCSILDLEGLREALAGHDAVVHLAGIDEGNDFPDQHYFETNVQGAWNVLHACEAVGVKRVVVASSTASLGIGYDRRPDYLPIDENHPQRPMDTYGLTKQLIESISASYARRGALRIVCLRPTLIVRPEREAALVAQLSLPDPDRDCDPETVSGGDVVPYGALSASRTYVRSVDCARCFRLALAYDREPFDVFNVAAPDTIGRVRTLERFANLFGSAPQIRDPELYRRDPYASALDSRRTKALLGWAAEGDWLSVVNRVART